MKEVKIQRGFIAVIPEPEEHDQKALPRKMIEMLNELMEEIDYLHEKHGDKARAEMPWDARGTLEEHERQINDIKKMLGGQSK